MGALAVMLGAFAAHSLKTVLPQEKIDVFQKGVTYQFYHTFALLITGMVAAQCNGKMLQASTPLFLLGILFFSGSLYLFPVLEVKNIGIPVAARLITPLGGLCFIAGWITFLISIIKGN